LQATGALVVILETPELRAQLLAELDRCDAQEVGDVVALLVGEVLVVGVAGVLDARPPLVASHLGRLGPADAVADLVVVADGVLRLVLRVVDVLQEGGVGLEQGGERDPDLARGLRIPAQVSQPGELGAEVS